MPAVRLPKMSVALNFPWLNYTFFPKNLRRVEEIIERYKPDVLHLHNHMFDLAFMATSMRRRTGKPLVVTIHTVIKHARGVYNLFLYPADRVFLKRLVINRTDAVICPDVNVQEYVKEAFNVDDGIIVPYMRYGTEKT
ncbi:MAG: glycosyltransferase family 4 protein [Acidobacteriota bacterium]|nr:glycosyltransferase family 4 protein [Acidobacteriota bacterium]